MQSIDIESLLMEITPEAPSGEIDLVDDPAFIDLSIKIEGTPEREFGGKIVQEAKDPDWSDVIQSSAELLRRSHDLRVVMCLLRSLLHTEGIEGLSSGLALLHGLTDRFWESLYPRLDQEDNDDPTQRVNILAALSEGEDILGPLKKTALCESPSLGSHCYRDILIASGRIDATIKDESPQPSMVDIDAAFKDSEVSLLAGHKMAITESLEQLSALKTGLAQKIGNSAR